MRSSAKQRLWRTNTDVERVSWNFLASEYSHSASHSEQDSTHGTSGHVDLRRLSLANYKEFLHMLHIGKESFLSLSRLSLVCWRLDLLWGVAIGILAKFIVEAIYGVKPAEFFRNPALAILVSEKKCKSNYSVQPCLATGCDVKRLLDSLAVYQVLTMIAPIVT